MKRLSSLKKSILLSTLFKPIGMLVTAIYTPMLLAYLGEEKYGIWVTILSVINWINYFDVGIGNGYRNILAEEIAIKDYQGAKQTTSTAYIILSFIISIVCIISITFVCFFNINALFNTDVIIKPALIISIFFICINFVLALCKTQLYAIQKSEFVGFMTVLINTLSLVGIALLTHTNSQSVLFVAILVGVSGFLINVGSTVFIWWRKRYLIPKLTMIDKNQLKKICNLGIKFFLIQISALILYTTDNMIISHIFGPASVTPYATAYSAFGIVNSFFAAMMAPLWSKYTEASVHNDYRWIRKTIFRLDRCMIPILIILTTGIIFYKPIAFVWLRKELNYPPGLIICIGVNYMVYIWGSIYSTVMNGMSIINLQLSLSIISAVLNIPLSIFLATTCGLNTTGVIAATTICMLFANIPVTVYVHHFIEQKIKGDL